MIVFLHGLMGQATNWNSILKLLEPHFSLLSYDQRGHGKSIKPKTGYSPQDYSNDLLSILEELDLDDIFLIGHSMGGKNALHFSYKYPKKVKKLVLIDISPDPTSISSFVSQVYEKTPTPFSTREHARDFFFKTFSQIFPSVSKQMVLFLYSNIKKNTQGEWDWVCSYETISESCKSVQYLWDFIKDISVPTLVLRGSESLDFTQESYEKMLHLNSNIKGVVIDQAGHWVHRDQPEVMTEHIKEFLLKPL